MPELSRRRLLKSLALFPAICRAQQPVGKLIPIYSWQGDRTGDDGSHWTRIVTVCREKGTAKYWKQITDIDYPPPQTGITPDPAQPFMIPTPLPNGQISWSIGYKPPQSIGSPYVTVGPPQSGTFLVPANPSDITVGPFQSLSPLLGLGGGVANARRHATGPSNPDGVFYVLDEYDQALFAMDSANLAQLAQLNLPGGGVFMALSPDAASIYISETGLNSVIAVDTESFSIRGTFALPTGTQPGRIMMSPDSRTVYVVFWPATGNGAPASPSGIYVLNGAQMTLTATINSPSSKQYFYDADITPDGQLIYAMASTGPNGQAYVIDTASNSVVGTIALPLHSSIPALNKFTVVHPAGKTVYVANEFSQIRAIDTASNTVVTTINLVAPDGSDLNMLRLQVNSSGSLLVAQAYKLVTNSQGDSVEHSFLFLIDTVYNVVVTIIDMGQQMGEGVVCFGVT